MDYGKVITPVVHKGLLEPLGHLGASMLFHSDNVELGAAELAQDFGNGRGSHCNDVDIYDIRGRTNDIRGRTNDMIFHIQGRSYPIQIPMNLETFVLATPGDGATHMLTVCVSPLLSPPSPAKLSLFSALRTLPPWREMLELTFGVMAHSFGGCVQSMSLVGGLTNTKPYSTIRYFRIWFIPQSAFINHPRLSLFLTQLAQANRKKMNKDFQDYKNCTIYLLAKRGVLFAKMMDKWRS